MPGRGEARTWQVGVRAAFIAAASFWIATLLLKGSAPTPPAPAAPPAGPGTITARVLDPDGQPVACAATLWQVVAPDRRRLTGDASQGCSPTGELRWTGREPGRWRLMAVGPGVEQVDLEVELPPGEGLDLGALRPGWGGGVTGRVLLDGQPVAEGEVRAPGGQRATIDPQGRYLLRGLPVGEHELVAGQTGARGRARVEVRRGEQAEQDILLERLPPRGTVGLVPGEGAVVEEVLPGSPAEGQVQVGDRVVAVDGQPVGDDLATLRRLAAGAPGEPVRLELARGGARVELTLTRVAASP